MRLSEGRRSLMRSLGAFTRDRRGNFTILFALIAPLLVVIVGMGVDYYAALSDKSRLDTAADAAALAAVNTAKAYYATNAGSQSGTTLGNNAAAAGQAQGLKVFAANVGSTVLAGSVVPTISVPSPASLTFTASVSWTAQVTSHFGPLVGRSFINISGAAQATTGLPKYLDFYVVVDTSGSMGIPTNAGDQQTLIETNPDNPIEAAAGYAGGCQFACHFNGYQGFTYTQNSNIQLKLNSVGASLQALLDTATSSEAIANQFRVGIYPFIVNPIVAAPLSSDLSASGTVSSVAAPSTLAGYLDQGGTNSGMGSGGNSFREFVVGFELLSANPGDRPQPDVDLAFHYSDHRRCGQRPDLHKREFFGQHAASSKSDLLHQCQGGRLYGGGAADPIRSHR